MKPYKKVITELFNECSQYLIPLFQRGYVWTLPRHVAPLWQDLIERVDALEERQKDLQAVSNANKLKPLRKHFLGTLVVTELKSGTYSGRISTREVIDGQQRLTTLQILLLAFRDVVKPLQDGILNDMLKPLHYNTGYFSVLEDNMKLMPTNAGREDMKALYTLSSLDQVCDQYPVQGKTKRDTWSRPLMVQTYLYFYLMIDSYLKGHRFDDEVNAQSGQTLSDAAIHAIDKQNQIQCFYPAEPSLLERAKLLYNMLTESVQVMYLELEDEDDPQIIFETLNARGAPLQPSDLVRNFIFLDATRKQENVDQLYENYWKNFDERDSGTGKKNLKFWRQEETQGRLKNTRLDLLLYHYVVLRKAEEFKVGHVFDEFKAWWISDDRNMDKELKRLNDVAKHFEVFLTPNQDTRFGLFCRRLKQLDTGTIAPLVLFFLERYAPDSAEFYAVLDVLESYLIRRFVCGFNTKSYSKTFIKILSDFKQAGQASAADLAAALVKLAGDSQIWPNDTAFKDAWLCRRVYIGRSNNKVKAVLESLEQAQRSNKSEYLTLPPQLSIEHVLPQSWQTNYPFAADQDTPENREKRERLLHSIGNLTLVTAPLNSSLQNDVFTNKRPAITQNSLLSLNAYFQDTQNVPEWNEDAIVKRAELLFNTAKVLWPYPVTV